MKSVQGHAPPGTGPFYWFCSSTVFSKNYFKNPIFFSDYIVFGTAETNFDISDLVVLPESVGTVGPGVKIVEISIWVSFYRFSRMTR